MKNESLRLFIVHRYAGLERCLLSMLCITRGFGLDIRILLRTNESHGV